MNQKITQPSEIHDWKLGRGGGGVVDISWTVHIGEYTALILSLLINVRYEEQGSGQ